MVFALFADVTAIMSFLISWGEFHMIWDNKEEVDSGLSSVLVKVPSLMALYHRTWLVALYYRARLVALYYRTW